MTRQEQITNLINELSVKKRELLILQTLEIVDNLTFDDLTQKLLKDKRGKEEKTYVYFNYPIPLLTNSTRSKIQILGGTTETDFTDDRIKNEILKRYKERIYEQCESTDIYVGRIYNQKYKPLN